MNGASAAATSSETTPQPQRKRKWDVPAAVPPEGGGGTIRKRKWDVPAAATQPPAGLVSGRHVDAATIARAQQGAAAVLQKINQDMAAKGILPPSLKPAPAPPVPQEDPNPTQEVVINDAEPTIRIQLTKRSTQDDIFRKFNCVAITRGRYRPPNMPDCEEKPLHLAIQASGDITKLEDKKKAIADAAEYVQSMIRAANRQQQPYGGNYNAVPGPSQTNQPPMGPTLSVYVGFIADPSFNVAGRLRGPNDSYFGHIMSETGATAQLRGSGSGTAESPEPLHVFLSCPNPRGLEDAKRLVENLIQTVRNDYMRSVPPVGYVQPNHLPPGPQAQYPMMNQQLMMNQGGFQAASPADMPTYVPPQYGSASPQQVGPPMQNFGVNLTPYSSGPMPHTPLSQPGGISPMPPQPSTWNPHMGQPLYPPPSTGYSVQPVHAAPNPQLYSSLQSQTLAPPHPSPYAAPQSQNYPPPQVHSPASLTQNNFTSNYPTKGLPQSHVQETPEPSPTSNHQPGLLGSSQASRPIPEQVATPPGRRRRFRETNAKPEAEAESAGVDQASTSASTPKGELHSSSRSAFVSHSSGGGLSGGDEPTLPRTAYFRRWPPGSGPSPASKPPPLSPEEARRLMPPPPPRPPRSAGVAGVIRERRGEPSNIQEVKPSSPPRPETRSSAVAHSSEENALSQRTSSDTAKPSDVEGAGLGSLISMDYGSDEDDSS